MEEKILKTLRGQAWQRAKGEMRAALDTFWEEREAFDIALAAVNAFIDKVESDGLFE